MNRYIDADALMERMYHDAFETNTDMQSGKEQVMSDYIKRADAINALEREKSDWNNNHNVIDTCIERLNEVKSADRPQGEWIVHSNGKMCDCSVCNESYDRTFEYVDEWNFCP